ncbi:DUF3861 domain-containing protein [Shewanella intestini]|nr:MULTISPECIES: DUF3861 domain-containing protein [Shewanella]
MINSKDNRYKITIEEITVNQQGRSMAFEVQDREDIFNVVENLKQRSGLDEQLATKLGVSLRLLGPIMMHNRKHPLFADFMPHFKNFMQNLKNTVKAAKGN